MDLGERNLEIKGILAQLRIPKMDALILERLVSLEFLILIHEIVIVFLPQELTKLESRLNLPNLMIGEHFIAKLSSFSVKRKAREMAETSNPLGKGKQ